MNNWKRIKYNEEINKFEGNNLLPYDEYIFLLYEDGYIAIDRVTYNNTIDKEDYVEYGDAEAVIAWQPIIYPEPF